MKRDIIVGLAVTLLVGGGVLLVVLAVWSRMPRAPVPVESAPPSREKARQAPPPEPPTQPEPTEPRTLREALAAFLPDAEDTIGTPSDRGTLALALWAADHLRIDDVSVSPGETTAAAVVKDPDAERGKRFCVRWMVLEIFAIKHSGRKFFAGLASGPRGQFVQFAAVGSTQGVEPMRAARFCGVVTGRHTWAGQDGMERSGAKMVGMFDIPENR